MSINICDLCYEATVPACQDTYTFDTGLTAATPYTMILEDVNGNQYNYISTPAGGSGTWTLNTSYFPDGMFNQWSGSYRITFSADTSGDATVGDEELTIDGSSYFCIIMKMVKSTLVYD